MMKQYKCFMERNAILRVYKVFFWVHRIISIDDIRIEGDAVI